MAPVEHDEPYLLPGEKRYPGIGMILSFGFGILFWGTIIYLIVR